METAGWSPRFRASVYGTGQLAIDRLHIQAKGFYPESFTAAAYDFDGIGGINAEDMLIGERLGDLIRSGAFPDSRTFQGVDINNDGKVNDSDLTLFGLSLTDAIDYRISMATGVSIR